MNKNLLNQLLFNFQSHTTLNINRSSLIPSNIRLTHFLNSQSYNRNLSLACGKVYYSTLKKSYKNKNIQNYNEINTAVQRVLAKYFTQSINKFNKWSYMYLDPTYLNDKDTFTKELTKLINKHLELNTAYTLLIKLAFESNKYYMSDKQFAFYIKNSNDKEGIDYLYKTLVERIGLTINIYKLTEELSFIQLMFKQISTDVSKIKRSKINLRESILTNVKFREDQFSKYVPLSIHY